jgi:hypothetical protein
MRKRGVKIAALVLSGGVLLQFASCGALLAEQVLTTVASSVFSMLIQGLLTAVNTGA